MLSQTLRRGLLAWVVSLLALRAVVLQPEHCGPAGEQEIAGAIDAGIEWLVENQKADGAYLYRYDRSTEEDLGGYNIVRHAGILVTLEQAASAGVPGAADAADAGSAWARDRVLPMGEGQALADATGDAPVTVGASALWIVALLERRDRTGDEQYDPLLLELGHFVAGSVQADGSVPARYVRATGALIPGSWSKFYTGESFWALANLHLAFPEEGFDAPANRIANYLPDRDKAEEWWPPIPDHWAAYGYASMTQWENPPALTQAQERYIRRQAGLQSVQIRYESTRTFSTWTYLTRGRPTLGAGLGTLGEALNQWIVVAESHGELTDLLPALRERAACAANVIVERQAEGPDGRVSGAWFQFDITQMDDQQHTLSALLNFRGVEGSGS